MTQKDAESIGYRNPPKNSRFRPGQSGNPSGRPKGTRNFLTEIQEELNAEVERSEGGRRVRITKQRAIVKAFIAKAISGDVRAITTLMSYLTPASNGDDEGLSPDDQKLLAAFERRKAQHQTIDHQDDPPIDTENRTK